MGIRYIRETYGVPAKIGGRVEYDAADAGKPTLCGTIISARSAYLRVRMDGERRPWILHPTWALRYL